MKLDKLERVDLQVTAAGVLLLISLLAFPWFSISVGPFTATSAPTGAPDGWLGVLALIATIACVADLMVERYSPQTSIPPLGGSREMTRFILACGAAACVALKFIIHIHFNYFGWGFYVTVILAAGLVYSTLEARNGPLT